MTLETNVKIVASIILSVLLSSCEFGGDSNHGERSSMWTGPNAAQRNQNIASPHFPDSKAKSYLKWQKDRGCNTTHVILANQADGEGAGYSIYGPKFTFAIDPNYSKTIKNRVNMAKESMATWVWLITDDSVAYFNAMSTNPKKYVEDLDKLGIFDGVYGVVLGLEMDSYGNPAQWQLLRDELKKVYKGKIGTHHNPKGAKYAHLGDTIFWQENPGLSLEGIKSATRMALGTGKTVVMWEIARQEWREGAQAALDAGADGVGNW